jgi:hypothetical protein
MKLELVLKKAGRLCNFLMVSPHTLHTLHEANRCPLNISARQYRACMLLTSQVLG